MKKLKYTFTLMVMFYSCFSFAQFNTITPTILKKSENQKVPEKFNLEDSVNQKKNKKYWKQVLNIITKSDLKNEIDSLKTLIKGYNNTKDNRKDDFEKLKDSLVLLTKKQLEEKREKPKKQNNYTVYHFIDEPIDSLSRIAMPLKNKISVTSSYGARTHPIFGTRKMHNGIDLKASYENVYSVMDGIVTASGWDSKGGGNYIKVRHFNRFETSYLHLSEMYYKVGEKIKAGFIIGKSGSTGNSTGPHLHFSVKEFGQSINPSHFLNDLIKVNNLITTYDEH